MNKQNIQSILPLNGTQNALLFHYLQTGVEDPGLLQVNFVLTGNVDQSMLEAAWSGVTRRHESLRTSLHISKTQKPLLVVHNACELKFRWEDISDLKPNQQRTWQKEYCLEDRQLGLDLSQAPAMRMAVIRVDHQRFECVWSCHHLLLDGWSATNILKEWILNYESALNGKSIQLPMISTSRDYFAWRKSRPFEKTTKFWKKYLSGFTNPNSLDKLRVPSEIGDKIGVTQASILMPSNSGRRISRIASTCLVTPAVVVNASWAVLLSALSDSDDVVFGETNAGRFFDLPGREAMTGCFASVSPKRFRIEPLETISQFAKMIHQEQYTAQEFQHFSLGEIHDCSELIGAQPLFESLMVFENFPWQDLYADIEGGLTVSDYSAGITTTYPLTLVISPGETWSIDYLYDSSIAPDQVEAVVKMFAHLLENICEDTNQTLGDLIEWLKPQLINCLPPDTKSPVSGSLENLESFESVQFPRNSMELEISKIWEEILGISGIGIHSSFLDLGGRSITVMRMLAMIEDRLDRRFPLVDFIRQPTIAAVAAQLLGDTESSPWRSLIPIQRLGNKPPLVFVHAGGSHVLFLRALADQMGKDQPVYGLQPVGLDGECEPMETIEQIATHYVAELLSVQPEGPYYLAGHCQGSTVGFEMVRQLVESGKEVAIFVVLDSAAPQISREQSPMKWVVNRSANMLKMMVARQWSDIATISSKFVRRKIKPFAKASNIDFPGNIGSGSGNSEEPSYMYAVRQACLKAHREYVTTPFQCKLILLQTRDTKKIRLRWKDLVSEFETFRLPIGHRTMFLEPDVGLLAKSFEKLMAQNQPNVTTT